MDKKTKDTKHPVGFLAFLRQEAARQRQNGHISVANNYVSAANSFSRFLADRRVGEVSCRKVTPLLIGDYEAWLQTAGLCKNTTSFYLRSLQSVYHKAVRQGLSDNRQPFDGTYRGVARTVKRAIRPADVGQLLNLDIRQALLATGDYKEGKRFENLKQQLEFARDIFLFSFCARGRSTGRPQG